MWRCLMAVVAVVGVAALGPPVLAEETELARAIKATYLYKFAHFVQWPESALGPPSRPLSLCVIGDTELAHLASRAAAGRQVNGRHLVVRWLGLESHISDCHLLYIRSHGPGSVTDALRRVGNLPILTITDAEDIPGARGIVHFVIVEGRVRFTIDNDLARRRDLVISAKVLQLALRIPVSGGAR